MYTGITLPCGHFIKTLQFTPKLVGGKAVSLAMFTICLCLRVKAQAMPILERH